MGHHTLAIVGQFEFFEWTPTPPPLRVHTTVIVIVNCQGHRGPGQRGLNLAIAKSGPGTGTGVVGGAAALLLGHSVFTDTPPGLPPQHGD